MAMPEDKSATTPSPISSANPLTGRCFCGSVTYTLSSLPLWSYLCHCLDCRRFSGTSFAYNATFEDSALTVLTPSADDLYQALSTFGDDVDGKRQFCGNCGSPLFMTTGTKIKEMLGKVIVAMGTVDGSEKDERLKPIAEGWCKRREAWMSKAEGAKESHEW